MRRLSALCSLCLGTLALGCADKEFPPPDRAAQIAEAEEAFTLALFDTVTWESDEIRGLDGNVVYATHCRNCHGTLGEGDTEYARSRQLEVPSLVEPGWRWASWPDSVVARIYAGEVHGMPTFGVAGLTPREMDAVTYYLMQVLRPEVIDDPVH